MRTRLLAFVVTLAVAAVLQPPEGEKIANVPNDLLGTIQAPGGTRPCA